MTVPCRPRLRTVATLPMWAVVHAVHTPTRPRGDSAAKRPTNRPDAGGAPAIGIEARKGRDPAPPGLGAKHESPAPKEASYVEVNITMPYGKHILMES